MGELTAPNETAARRTAARRRIRPQWARRHPFAAFIACLIVFTLILRLTWGWYLTRQLALRLDKIRAAGHPTKLGEIVIEPVADAENAWLAFSRAGAAMAPGIDSPRNSVLEFPHYPPYGDAWDKAAEASVNANTRALQLARQARARSKSQVRDAAPGIQTAFSVRYSQSRSLANTLVDAAMYAHLRGDDAEAMERVLDVLHLGRALRQDPILISQLVAMGIDALALDTAAQIAPTLAVKPDGGRPGGASSGAQVRAIIADLLDERHAHEATARSFVAERAFVLDMLDHESAGTWAIRPLATRTKLRWLDGFDLLTEAAAKPNYAAARPLLARLDADWEPSRYATMFGGAAPPDIPRYSRWFEDGGPKTFDRTLEQHFRIIAERRAVAVSFAARLYRLDNGGWPADLAQLVPSYLPSVPADPFSDDGRPLGYVVKQGALPDGGDRPLVYFDVVGPPGPAVPVEPVIDAEPMFGWQGNRSTRQYRDLNLWLPTTRRFDEEQKKLAAEAVDDDPGEPDAPRDEEHDNSEPDVPAEQ